MDWEIAQALYASVTAQAQLQRAALIRGPAGGGRGSEEVAPKEDQGAEGADAVRL